MRLFGTTRVVLVLWTLVIGEPFAVVNGVVVVATELAVVEESSLIVMVVLAIGEVESSAVVLAILVLCACSLGGSSCTPVAVVNADVCVLSFPSFTVMVVGRLFAMNSAYCFSISLMPLLPNACRPCRI